MTVQYPDVDWTPSLSRNGCVLRERGEGELLFLFDGMQGSGEASMELIVPVAERLAAAGRPQRVILFDYAAEQHATFDELVETARSLVQERCAGQPCTFWAQSFGTLIATAPRLARSVAVRRFVLVSGFSMLAQLKALLATLLLAVTPTWLYRLTIAPMGRWLFGPPGDQPRHPFFAALARGTSPTARRRTSWLRRRSFAAQFADTPAPTRVWLGAHDRLIRLGEERAFFAAQAGRRADYELTMMPDCGHLVLPSRCFPPVWQQLFDWLASDAPEAQRAAP